MPNDFAKMLLSLFKNTYPIGTNVNMMQVKLKIYTMFNKCIRNNY